MPCATLELAEVRVSNPDSDDVSVVHYRLEGALVDDGVIFIISAYYFEVVFVLVERLLRDPDPNRSSWLVSVKQAFVLALVVDKASQSLVTHFHGEALAVGVEFLHPL